MTREEIKEGIAKRKLELVVRLETRLIHSLPTKVQKKLGHEPYTWETIPEYLKDFWLSEADKEMKELDSQGVAIKKEGLPQVEITYTGWLTPSQIIEIGKAYHEGYTQWESLI